MLASRALSAATGFGLLDPTIASALDFFASNGTQRLEVQEPDDMQEHCGNSLKANSADTCLG